MKTKLYQRLASALCAMRNCIASNNSEWLGKHEDTLLYLVKNHMPSGSGVDSGTKFDVDACLRNPERLVFTFGYHHMNESGMYDGWTHHKAIVTPSLQFGFKLRITGPDRNGIKEYLHDLFSTALDQEINDLDLP